MLQEATSGRGGGVRFSLRCGPGPRRGPRKPYLFPAAAPSPGLASPALRTGRRGLCKHLSPNTGSEKSGLFSPSSKCRRTPVPENSASAGRLEGEKKKVSQPPGEEGTAGPALPGAQAERAAGDVPAGPACPEPGSAAGGVPQGAREREAPIGPASAGRRSLGGLPGRPQSLQRGLAKCESHPPGRKAQSGPAEAQTPGVHALPADFFRAAIDSQMILLEK